MDEKKISVSNLFWMRILVLVLAANGGHCISNADRYDHFAPSFVNFVVGVLFLLGAALVWAFHDRGEQRRRQEMKKSETTQE